MRPGWSSTRGISNIDDDDYQTEFGQALNAKGNEYLEAVQPRPCDKHSKNLDKL